MRQPAFVLLALAATAGCHSGPAPAARHLPQNYVTPASLLRLPRNGGAAVLLSADRLTRRGWEIPSDVPPITRALGVDLEGGTVYAADKGGRLVAIDLEARRARTYPNHLRELSGTADGAVVLALDSARRPWRLANRTLTTYRAAVDRGDVALLRGPGAAVVAVEGGNAHVIGEQGEIRRFPLPAGPITTTWFGDLIAVTTDSGEVLVQGPVDASSKTRTRFVKLRGKPLAAVFSPSSHQLYVARERGDLVALDRFTGEDVRELKLPGAARAIRADRSGRWLLAAPVRGDSIWVIDLPRWKVAATIRATWAEDLPLIPDGKTLVVRQGPDVVAFDITGLAPAERGRIEHGANDVYMALAWSARIQVPEITPQVVATTTSDVDTTTGTTIAPISIADSAVMGPPPPAGKTAVFLQVSSSQNQDWAAAFAKQLHDAGFPATVMNPKTADEGYRVVIGPYPSRDDADAVGRRLGRPYFLITPGAINP